MGWTMWALQHKDDHWSRVPWKWYERFTAGKQSVMDPEGTVLQFAQVLIKLEDRVPTQLRNVWFIVNEVGPDGNINMAREDAALHAAVEMAFPMFSKSEGNVIAAQAQFAKRRHQNLATWKPSTIESKTLLDALRKLGVPC